jgi:hypothetical protein
MRTNHAQLIGKTHDVAEARSADMVLALSGTGWEPQVHDAEAAGARLGGGYRAIVHPDTGTAFGFVRSKWHPNSHVAAVQALDPLIRQGALVPRTVCEWDGGAMLAYQFQAPDLTVNIRGKDTVSPLLTLAVYHDGKTGDSAFFADFRWFCKNQMGRVAQVKQGSVRHTSAVLGNYADHVKDRLLSVGEELAPRYSAMRQLADRSVSSADVTRYLGAVAGVPDRIVNMVADPHNPDTYIPESELTLSDKRQSAIMADMLTAYDTEAAEAGETAWAAYNAATRYMTHTAGRSAARRSLRMVQEGGAPAGLAFSAAVERWAA